MRVIALLPKRLFRVSVVLALGLLCAGAAVARPQDEQASGAGQGSQAAARDTAADRALRARILVSFRALPIQDGVILVPRTRIADVDNVELRDGKIAINGTVVSGSEVRQRLGTDADAVLELSYRDADAQRRLLLGSGAAAAPETTPGAQAPQSPGSQQEPSATPPPATGEERPAREERSYRRVSQARVRIGGPIVIGEDEEVEGAAVAVGGSVDVNGRVRDAVVAVGGNVHLGPKAEVQGDVTAVGGTVTRDPSASVRGQVNEVDFAFPQFHIRPWRGWSPHVNPSWNDGPWRTVRLLGTIVRMGLFGVLAALVLLLAPQGVERVDRAVRREPFKAALVGFFVQLVFVPLLILTVLFLVISIIGIPLLVLVPFAILAFFVALLLGFTGAAAALAHAMRERFGWSAPGAFALLVVGLLFIWGLTLLGRIIAIGGGPFALIGGMLLLAGFLVEYAAWTVGLGGTILTRFGRSGSGYDPRIVPTEPVPPPPPPPDLPPDLAPDEPPRS